MNKNIKLIIIAAILIVAVFAAINIIGLKSAVQDKSKLQVSASFYPLYFFANQIGGDKASVTNITPAGAEPHDYDPSTKEVANIETSNLLILNGTVEAWGDKIKANLDGKNVTIVTAGQGFLTRELVEDGQTQKDPHVWLDPVLAKKEALAIEQGFEKADPKDSDYFRNNLSNLNQKLDQLNVLYSDGLRNCQQKDIITSHAAFGYLAQRYNLNQVAIAGLSPDEEPSSQQLAKVAQFAKKNNVKYIFFESLISPKLSQTIATEIGAKTLVLDPIEGISDNDIKSGKDYFTVMQDNLRNLQLALECKQ